MRTFTFPARSISDTPNTPTSGTTNNWVSTNTGSGIAGDGKSSVIEIPVVDAIQRAVSPRGGIGGEG